jgi:ATP-dependent exoDNAse (exonuclease V) beta subunit
VSPRPYTIVEQSYFHPAGRRSTINPVRLDSMLAGAAPSYSLIIFTAEPLSSTSCSQILRLVRTGVKVIIAVLGSPDLTEWEPFLQTGLIQLYGPAGSASFPSGPHIIVDGQLSSERDRLLEFLDQHCRPLHPATLPFNRRQYEAEHAPESLHLGIRAGAGTGKTATMVQRVLFLLHTVQDLTPAQIVMITFTREATHEMRTRLRQALISRYQLTLDRQYFTLLEQLGEMRIMTIHAFARELLQKLGTALGYGPNVRIREFQRERKQILERVTDRLLSGAGQVGPVLQMPLYAFVQAAEQLWTAMENRGLGLAELQAAKWGRAGKSAEPLHRLLMKLIAQAEAEMQALKQEANAVSLKDLLRDLDRLQGQIDLQRYLDDPIRFLFIDEFQDTDATQIRLAAWIAQASGARLFVVGDVKQSIYRFRGANYTAFDDLNHLLPAKDKLTSHSLVRSYRTGRTLLNSLDRWFTPWGRADLLRYIPNDDRLTAAKEGGERVQVHQVHERDRQVETIALIRKAAETLPAGEQIALLVRTNQQALEVRDWCTEAGIYCHVDTGGDFYTTEAVRDLFHLAEALLYPDDPIARVNLLNSPFSRAPLDWRELLPLESDPKRVGALLRERLPHPEWPSFEKALRLEPALSVLRRIIDQTNPVQRFYEMRLAHYLRHTDVDSARESARLEALRYSRNLDKLMQLLQADLSAETATLHAITQLLRLRRATNREEDQAPLSGEEERSRLICRTVHRAKGQEFHTVILPFTDNRFHKDQTDLILRETALGWLVGWKIRHEDLRLSNDLYESLQASEQMEIRREETRLLYVAFTRAKERLWVLQSGARSDTWGELINMAGEE